MTALASGGVSFVVAGVAQPKGNLRSAGHIDRNTGAVKTHSYEAGKGSRGWMPVVRLTAQREGAGVYFDRDSPVRVGIAFFLPSPKKRRKHHTVKPDIDKLVRSILDGLKGVLWADDSQVTELVVRKGYATTNAYVRVTVAPAAPVDEVTVQDNLFAGLEELRA